MAALRKCQEPGCDRTPRLGFLRCDDHARALLRQAFLPEWRRRALAGEDRFGGKDLTGHIEVPR